jgi:hypothetical protein
MGESKFRGFMAREEISMRAPPLAASVQSDQKRNFDVIRFATRTPKRQDYSGIIRFYKHNRFIALKYISSLRVLVL